MSTTKHIDLELDLEKIEELAKHREDKNIEFRAFLKGQDPDKIDETVQRLNFEISSQIDCTTCGNCCMKLKPFIIEQDIKILSQRLNFSPQQVMDEYLEIDEGDQYFKNLPCSFLKDKKCTVYNSRPKACKSFPHLHKPMFISRLWGVIENYSICPIVFNVFERLKTELNYK